MNVDRRAIAAWCLYDWAYSAFATVVTTFIFAVYVTRSVAPDPIAGTAGWSRAMAIAGVVIALASPLLGAIADRAGRRKPWLAAFTVLTIAATCGLWWVRPEPGYLTPALVLVGLATVGFELANVFYASMLVRVAPPSLIGRVSGWAWGMGYLGGLACLTLALLVFIKAEVPVFGLVERAEQANVRACAFLVAGWFALFAWPLFVWVPDTPSNRIGLGRAVVEGVATLGRTLRRAGQHRAIVQFLVASAFWRDGITTIAAFGGIYAAGTFGMSFEEIVTFAIALNVVAGIGAFVFAGLDDRIGAKRTIVIAVTALIAMCVPLLLVTGKLWFWVFALALGVFFGPAQAAGRSLMARLSPVETQGEMFGLYSLSGRAVGFLGPLALGLVTEAFASQRAGMASVLVFFVIGLILMLPVREPVR